MPKSDGGLCRAIAAGVFVVIACYIPLTSAEIGADPDLDLSITASQGKPFTLWDAIAIAIQRNASLQSARLDESSAIVDSFIAHSAFQPKIDASLRKTLTPDIGLNPSHGDPATTASFRITQPLQTGGDASVSISTANTLPGDRASRSSSISFSLSQPLFSGGGEDENLLSLRTNDIALASRRDALEREAQKTIFAVTEQYYAVRRRQLTLELTRRSVERARTFLDMTIAREAAKQTSLLEVRNARVQLLRREIAELQSRKQLDGAIDAQIGRAHV